jgi:hypothetical protein
VISQHVAARGLHCAPPVRLETLSDKRNDCMKKSEKIEIAGYALAIITIFTLIQSPLLNAIGVVMAVRMLFRLKTIYSKENKNA